MPGHFDFLHDESILGFPMAESLAQAMPALSPRPQPTIGPKTCSSAAVCEESAGSKQQQQQQQQHHPDTAFPATCSFLATPRREALLSLLSLLSMLNSPTRSGRTSPLFRGVGKG